jgi:hypothetical protein
MSEANPVLTPREVGLVKAWFAGETDAAIAARMNVTRQRVAQLWAQIRKKGADLGVRPAPAPTSAPEPHVDRPHCRVSAACTARGYGHCRPCANRRGTAVWTPERRARAREAAQAQWSDPERRARLQQGMEAARG